VPAASLAEALIKAWTLYTKKREWLYRLSIANEEKIKEWYHMDRRPTITTNGEVKSVFYNSSTKGPNSRMSRPPVLIRDVQVSPSSRSTSAC
jgi:hypothetical protein